MIVPRKTLLVIAGVGAAAIVVALAIRFHFHELDREAQRLDPAQRDRYFDPDAISESVMSMDRPNAVINGVAVNNTWKKRSVGVYAGFLKEGFHEGGTTGRHYYGYQYFPDVPPGGARKFSIAIAVPPLNRKWSVIAEFDPKKGQEPLRPAWK
jgi:hypothetical protein